MKKFLLIDLSHLFHRAKFMVKGTDSEKIGMTLHLLFSMMGKVWRTQDANHLVFCLDGNSWRKSIYTPYKRNRIDIKEAATPQEKASDAVFFEAYDIFRKFISEKTNCTVLEHPKLEADDLISGFIKSHPNDHHIVVSSDKDFEQLLSTNVSLYNGVEDQMTTLEGIFDNKGNRVKNKKTGLPKDAPDPAWSLFEKAVRGCPTDNIFSAYPGVREKGSRNKVGLREAFADRHRQGFNWSAVMMTRWTDHEGIEHRVIDDYNRNIILVDLNNQPAEIKDIIASTVKNGCSQKNKSQIGLHFLKFCGRYELVKVSEQSKNFADMFSQAYPIN